MEKMEICFLVAIILVIIPSNGVDAIEPALYVFGDSIADVGNNNYLSEMAPKGNFPHYGIDFPGGPTGRFTNGYSIVDYIAKGMRMRMSPAPFLSITNDTEMIKGVNFASAGSGILNSTGPGTLSMDTQIMAFEGVARNLTMRLGKTLADLFLAKSIFFFSSGGNDIIAHFERFGPQNNTQKEQFVAFLSNKLKEQIMMLHKLGVRKFAVFSTLVIGCLPATRLMNPSGGCVEELNDLSRRFKNATKASLAELSSILIGMQYSVADGYEIFSPIIAEPLLFGFSEAIVACCGSGRFNAESGCSPNTTYCSNRRDHVFWDWYHPTQAAYQFLAAFSLYGPTKLAYPINFKQLMTSKKVFKKHASVLTTLQCGSYHVS